MTQPGKYFFDDLQLLRRDAPFSGKPDQLLFVDGRTGTPQQERLPALMRETFAKRGWDKLSFVAWDKLSPDALRRSKAVVFVGVPRRPELTDADHATIKLLQRYVAAGGGVLLTQNTTQMAVNELSHPRRPGPRLWHQDTPGDRRPRPGQHQADRQMAERHLHLHRPGHAPREPGGKGSMLLDSDISWLCLYGVLPFLPEAPWQVVLSGGPKVPQRPGQDRP